MYLFTCYMVNWQYYICERKCEHFSYFMYTRTYQQKGYMCPYIAKPARMLMNYFHFYDPSVTIKNLHINQMAAHFMCPFYPYMRVLVCKTILYTIFNSDKLLISSLHTSDAMVLYIYLLLTRPSRYPPSHDS